MDNEITLPVELATCGLNLEEIGAIFVLFSLFKVNKRSRAKWKVNTEFKNVMSDLVKSGIIDQTEDKEMTIDITKLDLDPFWMEFGCDVN